MRHELRLISHSESEYGPGIQPYCVCGWVGDAVFVYEAEAATSMFHHHVDQATTPPKIPEQST